MSWSFVAVASGYASGMGTTLDCGTTLNVAAGDLLVAIAAVYNYSTTFSSIADTASGNSMTISTRLDDPSGDGMIVAAYKIGATANSTSTFRLTLSNQANYRGLIVIQARPDSGDTVELGFSPSGNTGTGTAITSGSGSASGNDIFAVAGAETYDYKTFSSLAIAGSVADGSKLLNASGSYHIAAWYKAFTTSLSSATGTGTLSASDTWASYLIAFTSTAPASEGQPLERRFWAIPFAVSGRRRGL